MKNVIHTEQNWLECDWPMGLIRFLGTAVTERKKDLLLAACFRRIWQLLPTKRGQTAVEVLERYADGKATATQLAQAKEDAWQSSAEIPNPEGNRLPEELALAAIGLHDSIRDMIMGAAEATAWVKVNTPEAISKPEEIAQSRLIREVFTNPFRPVSFDPAWRTRTVLALAESAYTVRELPSGHLDTNRLAVLSDALEEAGCDNAETLAHLRGPGPHVRGCWALDLLLGKS